MDLLPLTKDHDNGNAPTPYFLQFNNCVTKIKFKEKAKSQSQNLCSQS